MTAHDDTTREWTATATSSAVALLATGVVVVTLLWWADDVLWPATVGAVGAVLFAASCWLLSLSDRETVTPPLVSLLTVPVSAGLFGSSAVVALVLAGQVFPVEDASLVSVTALRIVGHVGIVGGVVLAVLGVALGSRRVLTPTVLDRYVTVVVLTGVVPVLAGTALVAEALVFEQAGPVSAVGDGLSLVTAWLVSPDTTRLNLPSFLFVVALVTGSVVTAVNALPVAELLGDSRAGRVTRQRVALLGRRLTQTTLVVLTLFVVALGVRLGTSRATVVDVLGAGPYDLLQAVVSTGLLRWPLVAVAGVALTGAAVGLTVRRIARESADAAVRKLGPVAGGLVVTAVALRVADPVYAGVLDAVVTPLPGEIASQVQQTAEAAVQVYGQGTFSVLLVLCLLALALTLVTGLRAATFLGYLSAESGGYSLASAGLFVATVFAGTIDAPTLLVVGGIGTSLLVWDAGRFATTLGREVGTVPDTGSLEVAHTAGALLVGVVGALAAVGVARFIDDGVPSADPATPVALVVVVVGILFLAAALR